MKTRSIEDGPISSLLAALENDAQELCANLRAGVASSAEQALAADLIEGRVNQRRPRPGSDWKSRVLVAFIVGLLEKQIAKLPDSERRDLKRKTVLYDARKIAARVTSSKMMSEREAYYALKEYEGRELKLEIKDDTLARK